MRPTRLVLRAFGPYAGEQTVDFGKLGGRSFFLICGPTGSGKTTLLDAICFALFGDTSGAERSGRQMRSDFADPRVQTKVALDFTVGSEVFRVERRPEQERVKKRGRGTTTQSAQATLWRRTEVPAEDGEGVVLASRWNEVTNEIERLLGFRSDQFRQVVMLPQGQFRRLLTASSDERESILETLFQTEVYRRIEEALKVRAREIRSEYEQSRQRGELILEQASATSLDELVGRTTRREARLSAVRARVERLRAAAGRAQDALARGRQIQERFRELEAAERALKALESRRQRVTRQQDELDRARKARSVRDAEVTVATALREVEDARATLDEARRALARSERAKVQAERKLAVEQERAEEREQATRERTRLDALTEKVRQLALLQAQADSARKASERARETHERARNRRDGVRREIESRQKALAEARTHAAQLEGHKAELETLLRQVRDRRKLAEIRKQLSVARATHKREHDGRLARDTRLMRAEAELKAVEVAWTSGQAAVLARGLVPGEPCPVCGATDHPSPAQVEGELATERQLESGREQVEQLRSACEAARRAEGSARETVVSLETRERSIVDNLGAGAETSLAALEPELARRQESVRTAQRAQDSLDALDKSLRTLKTEYSAAETQLTEREQELSLAAARGAELRGRIKESERDVPTELRALPALEEAQQRIREKVQHLKDKLEAAQAAVDTANQELAGCRTTVASAEATLKTRQVRADELRAAFQRRLDEAGFVGEDEYARAKREDEEITLLDETIKEYFRGLAAADDRLQRARQAVADAAVPDLDVLEAWSRKARQAADHAVRHESSLTTRIDQDGKWRKQLEKSAEQAKALEARYAVYGQLANVASGQNSRRISFQRYVLAALLDDVLIAATSRLKLMSRGRFYLQRARETGDRRSAGGLDLEVYDAYTGTTRAVSTISGGEGFMASLSLALGLADVVQAYAGGIRLETIFVDEGFGSLDPEALDLAIQTLLDLRRGGRLVGVISHVPDLKERVDARLEVTPGRLGSTARFVLD